MFILVGFIAGALGSLLGLGGGIIMIPVLTILLDVDIKSAISSSLVSLVATSVMTVSVLGRHGLINYRLGLLFVSTTIVGSFGGSMTGVYVHEQFLLVAFSVLLLAGAVVMVRRVLDHRNRPDERIQDEASVRLGIGGTYMDAAGQTRDYRVRYPLWGTALSTAAGWISGLLGVGGGIVQVPLMNSLCQVPMKVATATSSFMIGFTGLAGALVYFLHGSVDLLMTAALVIGIVAGSIVGSRAAIRVSSRTLLWLFVIVLVVSAMRLIHKALGGS